ncbi:helix-turn-helix domain-containing protein [Aquisphaera insulae]|uniref:helix-turn-helix domain-containing protein n=1 Tax=Aquisphaera insulae TaxID=2712864 RepID=UPI0013EDE739|nr:helix-turn-helix domain-containing protein [Aquisphaera insulae]
MSSDGPSLAGASDPARPMVRAVETDDLDEIRQAFVRWDQRLEQLEGGPFRGGLRLVDLGGVQLLAVRSARVVRARGARPDGSCVFSTVTDRNAGSSWRGRTLGTGMVNVIAPDSEMDHRTCSNYQNVSIVVQIGLLEWTAAALIGVGLDRILCGDRALAIGSRDADELSQRLHTTLLALSTPPDGKGTEAKPLVNPDDLVVLLLDTLTAGRVVDPFRTTTGQRLAAVRKVEEYVRAFPDRRPGVLELCKLAGVSKRTLHYAFLEATGCTPKDFIKAIKLNAARRALRTIGPGAGHVEQVARRYGFHRPGNFASDFRRLFGELPSEFIRKP